VLSQDALNQYHTDKLKLSLVLFDEIEKASDALWNLLLGILDKAILTLGNNRRVDFSRALIFMTSNLGASEIGTLLHPKVGFAAHDLQRQHAAGDLDGDLKDKLARAGVEAARRKFAPEFMNRIDHTVVFRPLGSAELQAILTIELNAVQERVRVATPVPFAIVVNDPARQFLLSEGTDPRFGARHLKRAIDRHLVHPISNLIATHQISGGDILYVDLDPSGTCLAFSKDGHWAPAAVVSRFASASAALPDAISHDAVSETVAWFRSKTLRR